MTATDEFAARTERAATEIPVRNPSGAAQFTPMPPDRWHGHTDCIVGPFSGREIAWYFADRVVDDDHREGIYWTIYAHRDSWYVRVE